MLFVKALALVQPKFLLSFFLVLNSACEFLIFQAISRKFSKIQPLHISGLLYRSTIISEGVFDIKTT